MVRGDNAVEYLPDSAVDEALDRELRELLTVCFTKPQDTVFKAQRYFRQPYRHRWVIRDEAGRLSAHAGVHEKRIEADGRHWPIGGVAEVCVRPDCRGRGYVKAMLACAHEWMTGNGATFSVLFGRPEVYASSGYASVDNLVHDADNGERQSVKALVKVLTDVPWPAGVVYLPGPKF